MHGGSEGDETPPPPRAIPLPSGFVLVTTLTHALRVLDRDQPPASSPLPKFQGFWRLLQRGVRVVTQIPSLNAATNMRESHPQKHETRWAHPKPDNRPNHSPPTRVLQRLVVRGGGYETTPVEEQRQHHARIYVPNHVYQPRASVIMYGPT